MEILYWSLPLAGMLLMAAASGSANEKQADTTPFEVYAKGYFVKNNAPLPGNPAYLVLQDKKSFEQIFGIGFVMGGKPKLVDDKLFEANLIATVIKSGNTLWKYEVTQVHVAKEQLFIQYKATGKESSAKLSVPLIVSVPRGGYAQIVFVENGKEVGKASLKK
jgi:hypothetical protein